MRLDTIRQLGRDQKGLSTVEYTVLLVLVVACTVGLWKRFGDKVEGKISGATATFDSNTKID